MTNFLGKNNYVKIMIIDILYNLDQMSFLNYFKKC